MQTTGALTHKLWDFIEDGIDWPQATTEEQVYFREVAVGFLRATFTPPDGYVIDVLEAEYHGRFPVIALGWNEPEPCSHNERTEVIRRMVLPLRSFVQAVDWEEVARIRTGIGNAPGPEDLKRLLQQHATLPLAQRCLQTLSDGATTVHLAPSPVSATGLYNTHAKRAAHEVAGRGLESSEDFLTALKRMADAGESVCIHSIATPIEQLFVITDAAIQNLVVLQAIRDSR